MNRNNNDFLHRKMMEQNKSKSHMTSSPGYLKNILFILLGILLFSCSNKTNKQYSTYYIGTYSNDENKGIYEAQLNLETGDFVSKGLKTAVLNPHYIHVSEKEKLLFSVARESDTTYVINSYQILNNDSLKLLSSVPSLGVNPCYVEYDVIDHLLLISNYTSGSIAYFHVNDGVIAPGTKIDHCGQGPDKSRQESAHAHSIRRDSGTGYIYSADLGADRVFVYEYKNEQLLLADSIVTKAGAGPRHLDFNASGTLMALVNELDCTVSLYSKNKNGVFNCELQTLSIIPDTLTQSAKAADIHFSPDGKNLYASVRGFNAIAAIKIEGEQMSFLSFYTEGVNWPRNFTIDDSGKFLLVANRYGQNVLVLQRNEQSGELTSTQHTMEVDNPVCLKQKN